MSSGKRQNWVEMAGAGVGKWLTRALPDGELSAPVPAVAADIHGQWAASGFGHRSPYDINGTVMNSLLAIRRSESLPIWCVPIWCVPAAPGDWDAARATATPNVTTALATHRGRPRSIGRP